LAENYICRT